MEELAEKQERRRLGADGVKTEDPDTEVKMEYPLYDCMDYMIVSESSSQIFIKEERE